MCQARVSNKSVLQKCFRVLRERVFYQSVPQECQARVSHKSVPQECPTRVCHKSVTQECPTRLSEKSIKHEHLLFAFHCSVGTLLLRELPKNAFGFVASFRFTFNDNIFASSLLHCFLPGGYFCNLPARRIDCFARYLSWSFNK